MGNPRKGRRKSDFKRSRPSREPKPTILIVCEGKNTEPSYFNGFKISSATVEVVGEGYNTLSLVNQAEKLRKKGDYDHVWCVFDKDDFPAPNFDNAISKAEKIGFQVAWSNQSFEYWLLLHFEDHQGGSLSREDYTNKLNKALAPLGLAYDGKGSKNVSEELFDALLDRICLAINRATRNLQQHQGQPYSKMESATTVHELVNFLGKYMDPELDCKPAAGDRQPR